MGPVLELGPVVPASRESPRPAGSGLELGEVQLPDLVRPGRVLRERGFAALGKLPALALVLVRQDQTPVSQPTQHCGLRYDVAVSSILLQG